MKPPASACATAPTSASLHVLFFLFQRWNQSEQIGTWKSRGEFPCIVKSADLDDSRGISIVYQDGQLEAAVEKCFEAGAGSAIVEK